MGDPYAPPPEEREHSPRDPGGRPGQRLPDGAPPAGADRPADGPTGPAQPGREGGPAAGPRSEVDLERARHALVLVRRFAVLLLAGLICLELDLPWKLAGIPFTGLGVVVGVRATAAVRRSGLRGATLPLSVIGLALAAVVLFAHLASALFYPIVRDHENCLAGANTERARQACQQDYERRLENFGQLGIDTFSR